MLVLLESLEELGIRGQHPSVFSVGVLNEELILLKVVLLLRLPVPELLVLRLIHVLFGRFLVLYRRRVLDLRVLEGVVVFLSLLREAQRRGAEVHRGAALGGVVRLIPPRLVVIRVHVRQTLVLPLTLVLEPRLLTIFEYTGLIKLLLLVSLYKLIYIVLVPKRGKTVGVHILSPPELDPLAAPFLLRHRRVRVFEVPGKLELVVGLPVLRVAVLSHDLLRVDLVALRF